MATVSASLQLFDNFSQRLNTVNSAVQATTRQMERLRTATNAHMRFDIQIANEAILMNQVRLIRQRIQSQLRVIQARIQIELPASLQAMFGNLQMLVLRLIRVVRQLRTSSGANAAELQAALARIADLERKIAQLQEQINGSLRRGEGASSGLLANLKGMAAAYLSLQGLKELFSATVGGAMDQQKMEDMFIARTGQEDVGRAMFDRFKKNALEAGQDVNESLKGSLSFSQQRKMLINLRN